MCMAYLTKPCVICGTPITKSASQFTTEHPTCSFKCKFQRQRQTFGAASPAWKGGTGTINGMGYLVVRRHGKTILVHRLVMEEHLCRPLQKGEVVHHINGDKLDNTIENLMLCRTQAAHVRDHHGERPLTRTTCRICGDPELAKQLCNRHYKQATRAQRRGTLSIT